MRDVCTQLAFETWASSQGLIAERAAGGERYRCDIVQAQWLAWQAAAVLPQFAKDRYWVQRTLMERVRNALRFYSNPKNYEALQSGGLFSRVLGEPKPTAQELSLCAASLLRDLEHPRGVK